MEIRQYKLDMKCHVDAHGANTNGDVLGEWWWRSFLKRNKHRLVSKKGRKFAVNRDLWCIYANFADMYDAIYDDMVDAGVAEKMSDPAYMNAKGEVVDKDKAVGRKCTHRLIYPNYCLVADETGSNMATKGDGHIGGVKYLARAGTTPQNRASEADNHFTTMCFMGLNGKPAMCLVIFKGEIDLFLVNITLR